jgi:hypothetical protein
LATKPVRFSDHAREEMARRDVPLEVVQEVLKNPDQILPEHGGLVARQGRVTMFGRKFLVRVVVAERPTETVVVTVY